MRKPVRVLEFLAVLIVVATAVWVVRKPNRPSTPPSSSASANIPTRVTTPAATPDFSDFVVEGYFLKQRPLEFSEENGLTLKFNDLGEVISVRGRQLSRDGVELFAKGASHDEVKAALGPAVAFAHGGLCWGYWQKKGLPDPNMGLLIKFNHQGVEEIVIHQDWVALSTELALSSLNGPSEPVDGSDGYKDFREWAERSKAR